MTPDRPMGDGASMRTDWRRSTLVALVGMAAAMWVVQIVDEVALGDRLEGGGIRPRQLDGLLGIVWAPFLHGGFGHLIANTVPFLVLGALVVAHGRRNWMGVTVAVVIGGGALTWLLGRSANHIGASGLIFGYLGYLVVAAVVRRNLTAIVTGVVAVILYGGIVIGFLPRTGVSWEGHLFGAVAGAVFGRFAARSDGDAHAGSVSQDYR